MLTSFFLFPSDDGIGDLRTGKEKKKANASYAV
jgi:hypothetical protein